MDRILKNNSQKFVITLVFLIPTLALFLFTVILPVIWSAYYSLFSWDGITPMAFIGMGNFIKMFTHDSNFKDIFMNNLIYVLINSVFQVLFGLIIAILLTYIRRGQNFFKTVFFIPCIISSVAIGQLFMRVYSLEPQGIINALLQTVGLGDFQKAWTSDFSTALISVSAVEVYRFTPLYMMILYAALVAIPKEIIESSKIDGAYGWNLYRYIKLPLIRDVIVVTIVMVVNGTLKGFDVPFILTYGGPGHSTELIATYMYKAAFSTMQYGYGSAIAVFLVIESLVAVFLIRHLHNE